LKILIVTQYFWPENFKINDLAFELNKRGHSVHVLTGIPNYPSGYAFNGYKSFRSKDELFRGVKIFRTPIITRGKNSRIRLFLNYLSFVISGSFRILKLNNDYDSIFIYEPSPLTVAIPAILKSKIIKKPSMLWVTDLWPDSVTATIKSSRLVKKIIYFLLNPIVRFIYKNVDKILVTSEAFIPSIEQYGIDKKEIDYFPQWAEPMFKPLKGENKLLKKINNDSFKIMFAGNLGEAQDFPSILKTARALKSHKQIQWIILGDGRKKEWIKNKISDYGIEKCFHLFGNHPIEKMPMYYAEADVMLLTLKENEIFSKTIPAKLQTYMACGKPIVAMIDGEASKIINQSNAGLVCSSADSNQLSKHILKISNQSKDFLNKMSINSIKYYNNNFDRNMLINKIEKTFFNLRKN